MRNRHACLLLLWVIFLVALPACVRVASLPPVFSATPTSDLGNIPVITMPAALPPPFLSTQTAMALTSEPTPTAVIVTPTSGTSEAEGKGLELPTAEPPPVTPTSSGASLPTAAAAPLPTASSRPLTYVLQYGEWPICIARRYDLDLNTFFAINGLNMNSKLLAGTVLRIPQTGNWSLAYGTRYWHPHPAQYVVRPGDNIYSIACYYGDIEPEVILAANGLDSSSVLRVGQVLQIP